MHYMQCYITVYNALLFINAILFVIICYIINILTTDNTPNNVVPIITVTIDGKTEIVKSGSYNDLVLRNIDYHDPYSLIVLTIQVDPQHSCHITFGDPTTPGVTIGEKSMVFTNKEGVHQFMIFVPPLSTRYSISLELNGKRTPLQSIEQSASVENSELFHYLLGSHQPC